MFFVGLMIPLVALFSKKNNIFRYYTSKLILLFSGVKISVQGKPDSNTQLFFLNHQSMLDIMVLEVVTGKKINLAWVAKIELFKLKPFGLSLSLTDMIAIDRENKQGIIKLLKDVKDRVSKNRVVAIFPEGTRNTKNRFLPFKSGTEIIANKLKLRVQPVILVNSAKRFNVKNFTATRGEIKVIFLESFLATKDKEWLQENKATMEQIFLKNL
jgi:1-acyl-sn-glycerol-3-phosphate acyltransferase